MATTSERWTKGEAVLELGFERRQELGRTPDDYVTLRRSQVEGLLTQAGYEKEKSDG